MMQSRRMFLKTGAAAILVTGAAGAWWATSRTPEKALAPWDTANRDLGDPRLNALAYAILSPNPHNRQPWQVELVGTDELNLFCELDRRLPHTDPYDRQITIGLGCFLELYSMAAKAAGYVPEITYFPDGEPEGRLDSRRVAHISMKTGVVSKDPLFNSVFDRRSTKEPFDVSRPIGEQSLIDLLAGSTAKGTVETDKLAELRELSWSGHVIETETPRTLMESVNLMRFGKAEVEANPDGIDFSGVKFELLNKTGLMTRENIADPTSTAFQLGLDMYEEMLFSAMGYVWIQTEGNSRQDQLNAGREWVRLNLKATQLGLAIHPLSQALQEYPEMKELYQSLHTKLEVDAPARLQMFARIGYGPKVKASPRWPMESRLVTV